MTNNKFFIRVAWAVSLLIFTTSAEVAFGGDCELLLGGGVFDHRDVTDVTVIRNRLRYAFCKEDAATLSDAKKKAGALGIDVPGEFNLQASASDNEQKYQAWRSWLCSDTDIASSRDHWYSDKGVVASKDLLAAYNQCLARDGFKYYADTLSDDGESFILNLKYVPQNEKKSTVSVHWDIVPAAECTLDRKPAPDPITVGITGRPLICKRNPCKDIFVVVHSLETAVTPQYLSVSRWKPGSSPPLEVTKINYTTTNDMKAPFSFALPTVGTCRVVTTTGTWYPHCPNQGAPATCPTLTVTAGQASSGQFDGPNDYGDNCGTCSYALECSPPPPPAVPGPHCGP